MNWRKTGKSPKLLIAEIMFLYSHNNKEQMVQNHTQKRPLYRKQEDCKVNRSLLTCLHYNYLALLNCRDKG